MGERQWVARRCPSDGKMCGCLHRLRGKCYADADRDRDYTSATLSIEDRIRLSQEMGILEYDDWRRSGESPYGTGIVVRRWGIYWLKAAPWTSIRGHPPSEPGYRSDHWEMVAGPINAGWATRVPRVRRRQPA